jgi:hypothetical protein
MDYYSDYSNYYSTPLTSSVNVPIAKLKTDTTLEAAQKRNNKILRITLGVVSGIVLLSFLVIILVALLIPAHNSVPLPPTVTPPISVPTSVTLWM